MEPAGVAGNEGCLEFAGAKLADIDEVEAVDILLRRDGLDDLAGIDMGGKRQLHQYAVDGRIGIELADDLQQSLFGRVGRQRVLERMKAAFLGGAGFGGDIDLACRILADDDHRQTGLPPALASQLRGQGLDLLDHVFGDTLSVNHFGHEPSSTSFRPKRSTR